MKLKIVIATVFCMAIIGCGEQKIDMRMGSDSISRMMTSMSPQEQADFLSDIKLLVAMNGGDQFKLNGYTLSRVRQEAVIAKQYVLEKNYKFLSPLVRDMEAKGINSTHLSVNSVGMYGEPVQGYIPKSYSIDFLRSKIAEMTPNVSQEVISSVAALSKSTANPIDLSLTTESGSSAKANSNQNRELGAGLKGDKLDDDPNAEPNTPEDLKNKNLKKDWQDRNGFVHYADGSMSSRPID